METVETYRENEDGSCTEGFADLCRDIYDGNILRVVNFRDRMGNPMHKIAGQTIFLRFLARGTCST